MPVAVVGLPSIVNVVNGFDRMLAFVIRAAGTGVKPIAPATPSPKHRERINFTMSLPILPVPELPRIGVAVQIPSLPEPVLCGFCGEPGVPQPCFSRFLAHKVTFF